MALVDLQRRAVEVCFGPEPRPEQLQALGDERIWRFYREAVRKRLRSELHFAFKRTRAVTGDAFERAYESFLHGAPPRTRFFHAVVGCFAESAAPQFARDPALPAFTADLCAYEAALWTVSDLPDTDVVPAGEFAFDREPVLAPALRLLALGHAVHEADGAHLVRDDAYPAREVYLCVHRRPEEKKARTWTCNAVMFELMQRFARGGETVAQAVEQVAARRAIAVDEAFIDGLCTVLADFIDHGVILGGR
jgi:hypothetical protein